MRNLPQVIDHVYRDCLWERSGLCNSDPIGKSLYMTIPLTDNHIEVPAFVAYSLQNNLDKEAIIVTINHTGNVPPYKSLSCNIRYAIDLAYSPYHLIKITPDGEDPYYATFGAIFNKDYIPVMLMTWEMVKEPVQDLPHPFMYKLVRPVLRIAPEVFKKSNAVEKYIVNKILPEALAIGYMDYPNYENGPSFIHHNYDDVSPNLKAVIEECPFSIRGTDTPSISTTNKDLLSIALNNLDELMQ